ncbi:tRNA-splicing endonuclease subunit Sen15 isoform X2 [Narcine bancroftii]|uniref:tRNA-splicing endonuclease subunit Sen15 isoform X2 n=1 Tax=Narcine bancroftii TaxID=1343680 RepID=UPI00383215B2
MEALASGEAAEETESSAGLLRHPKYAEMMALNIGDGAQVYTAFLVFLDLLEARNWKDVTCKGSKELQLVYLLGCPGERKEVKVVLPLPVHMSLSHERDTTIVGRITNGNKEAYERKVDQLVDGVTPTRAHY